MKENNQRISIKERYKPAQQLKGDPDCIVGVKKSTNREQAAGSTKEMKEDLWGHGSGVVAATTPDYGDVVIAESTHPFNQNDISYFPPLSVQIVTALDAYPTNITADAACDACYVSDRAARHGGIGAVPRECSLLH